MMLLARALSALLSAPAIVARPVACAAALAIVATLPGCASHVTRERTLPKSIRTIHVPMILNRSEEIGLEEQATQFLQEQFLADGRLEAKGSKDADAIVQVTLKKFIFDVKGSDNDFAEFVEVTMRAGIRIERNEPGRPLVGGERQVEAKSFANVDERSISFEPEPVWKERMLRELARATVQEVMSGEYTSDVDPPMLQGRY